MSNLLGGILGVGGRWHRNQPIADDQFVEAWSHYIWKQARLWCSRGGLPDAEIEEYASAGFAALACVPPGNRWSSRYVMTAVRNRMLSAGRRRQGQPHPRAIANVDSLRGMSDGQDEDSTIASLDIVRAIDSLPPDCRDAMWLQVAGCSPDEIARTLGLDDAREILGTARALLRAALGPAAAKEA